MTILYATDFSESAEPAQAQAIRLARALGTGLVFLHVAVDVPLFGEWPFSMGEVERVYEAQRQWASGMLAERVAAAREQGIEARMMLRTGVPFEEIVKAATEESAEMIVMGTHGRAGLQRFLLGSVAARVVRLAPCPVLTVRPPENG
jgi:nucleotide-binding universal stress UspA family protein